MELKVIITLSAIVGSTSTDNPWWNWKSFLGVIMATASPTPDNPWWNWKILEENGLIVVREEIILDGIESTEVTIDTLDQKEFDNPWWNWKSGYFIQVPISGILIILDGIERKLK